MLIHRWEWWWEWRCGWGCLIADMTLAIKASRLVDFVWLSRGRSDILWSAMAWIRFFQGNGFWVGKKYFPLNLQLCLALFCVLHRPVALFHLSLCMFFVRKFVVAILWDKSALNSNAVVIYTTPPPPSSTPKSLQRYSSRANCQRKFVFFFSFLFFHIWFVIIG